MRGLADTRVTVDPARIERLLSVVRATRPVPHSDGSLYYASNATGREQVYRQPAVGAAPERLVESGNRILPHAHTAFGLLARADNEGDEIWQLGMVTTAGYRDLTHDPRAIHRSVVVDPDGRRAGLSWNPNGQADMVLGEIDLGTGSLTEWAAPGGFWEWAAWSPRGDRAAVVKALGTPEEGYLLDRDGQLRRILTDALRAHPVEWLDTGLLVLTDLGREFLGLALVSESRPDEISWWLFAEDHDLEGVSVSPSGDRAAVVVNEGIYDGIRIIDLPTGALIDRVELPPGVVRADHGGGAGYHVTWKPDGSGLFVSWEHPTHPAEIYEWPGGRRRTFTSEPPAELVRPVETSYETFDGLRIPSLMYRIDEQPRPAVVEFHGGPEYQSRATYQPVAHLLNSIGINVFLPNVRGSTGFGTQYQNLDDKTLRWNGVKDGCEAARHLKRTGAATRTAAMGGSYGGFMTLAVLVEAPDLWDAGVDVVGIANWHTFFRNMPPWRGVLRINEYGDPSGAEADFLREISPLHRAQEIKAPLLVIHGRNDPRVPVEESVQIARAVGAELLIFEDEGHGIESLRNQVASNRRILDFLAAHLL